MIAPSDDWHDHHKDELEDRDDVRHVLSKVAWRGSCLIARHGSGTSIIRDSDCLMVDMAMPFRYFLLYLYPVRISAGIVGGSSTEISHLAAIIAFWRWFCWLTRQKSIGRNPHTHLSCLGPGRFAPGCYITSLGSSLSGMAALITWERSCETAAIRIQNRPFVYFTLIIHHGS